MFDRRLRSAGQISDDNEMAVLRPRAERAHDGNPSSWSLPRDEDAAVPARRFFNNFSIKDFFFHDSQKDTPHLTVPVPGYGRAAVAPAFSDTFAEQATEGGAHGSTPPPPPNVALQRAGGEGGERGSGSLADAWLLPLWLLLLLTDFCAVSALSFYFHFPEAGGAMFPQVRPEERASALLVLCAGGTIVYSVGNVRQRLQRSGVWFAPLLLLLTLLFSAACQYFPLRHGASLRLPWATNVALLVFTLLLLAFYALLLAWAAKRQGYFCAVVSALVQLSAALLLANTVMPPSFELQLRHWFFCGLAACFCRENTAASGVFQALMCALAVQELGFEGARELWVQNHP